MPEQLACTLGCLDLVEDGGKGTLTDDGTGERVCNGSNRLR